MTNTKEKFYKLTTSLILKCFECDLLSTSTSVSRFLSGSREFSAKIVDKERIWVSTVFNTQKCWIQEPVLWRKWALLGALIQKCMNLPCKPWLGNQPSTISQRWDPRKSLFKKNSFQVKSYVPAWPCRDLHGCGKSSDQKNHLSSEHEWPKHCPLV